MMRTSSPLRTRRLRCQRCSEKKFRTTQDLALHVLSKHATLQLPPTPTDDARSITLSSPLLPGEAEELDQLLGSALRSQLVGDHINGFKSRVVEHSVSTLNKARYSSPKRPRQLSNLENRRKRSRPTNAETLTSRSCENPQAFVAQSSRKCVWATHTEKASYLPDGYTPVPGESMGPCAQDVFLAQYRSGRISLVPSPLKQTTTLNFANALF
ncbi:unnamed protein product [Agarophyton chilense]